MLNNFRERLATGRIFRSVVLSAAIAFPASARAATQQQCDTLKTLIRNEVEFEKTAGTFGVAVIRQSPILATAVLALQVKYKALGKEIDEADLKDILGVVDWLKDTPQVLDKGFDARVKVLNDAVTVIGDLCR